MTYKILTILVCIFFSLGCQKKAAKFDDRGYEKILHHFPQLQNKALIISYFDGDCSFCIAKVLDIEKNVKRNGGQEAVFIASTRNPDALLWNVKAAKVPLLLIVDTNEKFKPFLKLNEIVSVNRSREIIQVSKFSD